MSFCKKSRLRCRYYYRDSDILVRLGGDEFVAVVVELVTENDAIIVADKLLAALSTEYMLSGITVCASASIGICYFSGDNSSIDRLLSNADAAMYEAKPRQQGKNRYLCLNNPASLSG